MLVLILKVILALTIITFVGDIILMAFWKLSAEKTRNPQVLLFANKTVNRTDKFFLEPSASILALVSHVLAALVGVHIYRTPTLTLAMVAFILSGIVWVSVLMPTQKKQEKMCAAAVAANQQEMSADYYALSKRWKNWGYFALFLDLLAVVFFAVS